MGQPHQITALGEGGYLLPMGLRPIALRAQKTPLLFVFDSGSQIFASVFLLRTLTTIGGQALDCPIIDLESPHGYAGPIVTTRDRTFLALAHDAFLGWCADVGVTAEFVRFHPIHQNHELAGPRMKVELNRTTFSITVDSTKSSLDHFDSKGRNMVRRALAGGLASEVIDPSSAMNEFRFLYTETMRRVGADPDYLFTDNYFRRLAEFPPGSIQMLGLRDAKGVHTMGIFLTEGRGMHYHLSATRSNERVPGSTNLLICKAIELANATGRSWLHLGGGLRSTGDDSLSRFKESISDTRHNYFVGKRIHRPATWERAQHLASMERTASLKHVKLLAYHSCP